MTALLTFVDGLARWSYRRRGIVLLGWVAALLLSAVLYTAVGVRELPTPDGFVGEAGAAEQLEGSADFVASRTESVLVSATDQAAADRAAEALAGELRQAKSVESVGNILSARDGGSRLIQVVLTDEKAAPSVRLRGVTSAIERTRAAHPGITIDTTGPNSVRADVTQTYARQLSLLEVVSLPITAVVLFLVFAGIIAAAVPLAIGLAVVLLAALWGGITSHLVPMDENQISLIILMGLALGVDYSLFFVRRMREEFAKNPDLDASARIAVSATSHSVFIAGITTGVSVTATFLTDSRIFHSLTLGMVLVVVAALLASMTLLPALLGFGRKGVVHRHFGAQASDSADSNGGMWARLSAIVVRRPSVAAVIGAAVLVCLAAPALFMRLEWPGTDSMPRTFQSLRTFDAVAGQYPLYGISHTAATAVHGDPDGARRTLEAISEKAAATPGFAPERRAIEFSSDNTVARVEIAVRAPGIDSPEAGSTLTALREDIIPAVAADRRVLVGGETAVSVDTSRSMYRNIVVVIPFVLVISFLLVLLAFRSLGLAAMSVVLNLLSVLAAYGILVMVFQVGLGAPIFGSDYVGPVVTLLPIMLFVILFGLSMDYHVFILSRVREAIAHGARLDHAVRAGVVNSAAPVTAAAAVMVVVFAMFAILPTQEMKQLGIGLAAAIALDATIVRGILLPSVLMLLGDRVWRRSATPTGGAGHGGMHSRRAVSTA
ncbi:MMPL family transporter [Nocardia sp. CDC159]|uniref:MMPL family transporter n=1 Tax=Nocardia pulmonis TaxID=2951408 RepID=A0A9X2J119_9NOCA|nr:MULTISPECIES: MMPL family transporter [Nocardia]MCM6778419.1 MMPL family transporter [Nocardia pulmonis]MCM6791308.1 MMPL family transporter [Nocardia sp. CDC159]